MVSAKRRGVNFEYRCAYIFERFGYSWDRSGSSLGTDLKILKDGKPRYLVSCKKTSSSGRSTCRSSKLSSSPRGPTAPPSRA